MIEVIDDLVRDSRWMPYWGWHDDHRERDRTPAYLPALQQVRAEYEELLGVIANYALGAWPASALQLGMGAQRCSHECLRAIFAHVLTIDEKGCALDDKSFHGLDTQIASAVEIAKQHASFDFLMIDAGHKARDVEWDFSNYSPLVRPGGVIAVHDALKRPGYEEEIEVWRWLATFPADRWRIIGKEVGFAWTLRE